MCNWNVINYATAPGSNVHSSFCDNRLVIYADSAVKTEKARSNDVMSVGAVTKCQPCQVWRVVLP